MGLGEIVHVTNMVAYNIGTFKKISFKEFLIKD